MTNKPKTKEVVTYLAQPGMKPRKIFTVVTKPKPKTSMERFDEIGFGNQARIVGAKRVELKDFIDQELKQARVEMGKALRMKKDKSYKNPNRLQTALNMRAFGYNQAVRENNQKIDSYLKEREEK